MGGNNSPSTQANQTYTSKSGSHSDIRRYVKAVANADLSESEKISQTIIELGKIMQDEAYTEEEHKHAEFCRDMLYISTMYSAMGYKYGVRLNDENELFKWTECGESFIQYTSKGTKVADIDKKLEFLSLLCDRCTEDSKKK